MLLFLGDVHGEFIELSEKIARTQISDSAIIQVGDFGVGFRRQHEIKELHNLNRILAECNNTLHVIRGNHDDPSFFSGKSAFSNIHFLKDYALLRIEELNIFLIGGAVSVDRSLRSSGMDYWKNEVFIYSEELLTKTLSNLRSLDIVVTHNAPAEFWPYMFDNIVFKFSQRDELLLKDLQEERNNHSKLLHQFKVLKLFPKAWYYGHFHASYTASYKEMKYILLNCLELIEHRA